MSKGRRANKTGRSKGKLASFVALERYLIMSPAWRALKPLPRAAYVELALCYDGKNNGNL